MRLILDQNVPRALAKLLPGHDTASAADMGWQELTNGEILSAAEKAGFAAMLTADKNLKYQQSMKGRSIAVMILSTNHWPTLRAHARLILRALDGLPDSGYIELELRRITPKAGKPPSP